MRGNRTNRGNALIVVMVALAVLLMLVASAIEFTGTNNQGSIAKGRADEVQACATVARRVVLSKLKNIGGSSPTIDLNTLVVDTRDGDAGLPGDEWAVTGHLDDAIAKLTVVQLNASAMGSSRNSVREMANTLGPSTLGGQYYRVAVTCHHGASNNKSELEFTFRYGL